MDRTILHCDCNSFFASVECVLNPKLKEVPMAVAGNPENRTGIILAKNELAKKYNISTAETIWQAKKKCPSLVIVPPHMSEYKKYSRLINEIYEDFTDRIEPFGIDESWLDVSGVLHIFGSGQEIADKIRARARETLGLTLSVGVSFNKIFAKLGSDYKKPDATTVISRENYKEIVFPLPVSDLLFVGKSAAKTLSGIYIRTIGDLANSRKEVISSKLGKTGEVIWEYANGLEDSPVRLSGDVDAVKSVGNGMTFKRDLLGMNDIRLGVMFLADEVAYRLRKYGMKCRVVSVTIKSPDLATVSRQETIDAPTHLTKVLAETAMKLIKQVWNLSSPIRAITITGMNLVEEDYAVDQFSFFEQETSVEREKQEKIESAVDKIRLRYGRNSIGIAGIVGNDLGIENSGKKKR